ncbi:GNAT family N-acetyltransferase [Ralstonia sp. ASV6]|uniref:GNAT family N-acetyltransferase n=1 Tax=Ralstonia sp. ASV6 TaxID=2795124 RepID=UPI0018EE4289|nr:GNAT family N-acetyltransferase [Ralstonia sp. ASV6]
MKKIFIEDQRVDSFLADLRNQLEKAVLSDAKVPIETLFVVGVGESGTQMAQRLIKQLKATPISDFNNQHIMFVSVQKDEQKSGQIIAVIDEGVQYTLDEVWPPADNGQLSRSVAFLVIDGVCRSGHTLTSVYAHLRKFSARVWTYAVAVNADSAFIPTWYGCLYEGGEYVMLVRDGITPNTALSHYSTQGSGPGSGSPALVLRPPLEGDPEFNVGESATSIARYKSEDRYFDATTRAKHIMVLEWNSVPVGFVAYHIEDETLWIHHIVSCQSRSEPGVGTALYNHVENYAKLRGCENISLWAIEDKVNWYKKRGFAEYNSSRSITIGTKDKPEKYFLMTNRLVGDMGHYRV